MSLQFRILGSIAALLLLALVSGAALLSLNARAMVEREVRAAFDGARTSVHDTLESDVEHTVTMRQVVASFQGQRHVRAALINEKGKVIVKSEIGSITSPAPDWFARLMRPPQMTARININLPEYPCVVQLTSDPRSEIADVWKHARDAFLVMFLFCGATMMVVSLAVAYALRFFRRFQSGLLAVSDGAYDARLDTGGPPEFAALARGFNHMASRLERYSETNRRLQGQIQTIQEEERAGIARDLHDEVGPYLFAIQVDANAVTQSADPRTRQLGGTIREAALHIQQHVKEILRQLRPVGGIEFGLDAALADLVGFWSRRHPDICFTCAPTVPTGLTRQGEEAIYRIVQESVSNAVRHGRPGTVRIAVADESYQVQVTIEDDGSGFASDGPAVMTLGRMGLKGMQERLRTMGGHLFVEELPDRGVRIRAVLPKLPALEVA